MKIETTKERIIKYLENKGIKLSEFYISTGLKRGLLDKDKLDQSISDKFITIIIGNYPDINLQWLVTGEPPMLKSEMAPVNSSGGKNLIPYYDDVTSIGGTNSISASMEGAMSPSEYIDAGDWFRGATAAIRHYGDSMIEYPSGCVLVLKRVNDRRLIINGRNYVIETSEFRITKQLQDDGIEYIMAYSSNWETYPDGRQIHAPIRIPKDTIKSIDLVLGCVIKEQSSGAVYIKQ